MRGTFYLAWRYLAYHRVKAAILVASITLIVYLPAGLRVLVLESAEQLTSRAAATPLLVGSRGSPLDLVLNSLYFKAETPERMQYEQALRVRDSGLAQAIALHVRFRARGYPIVGTTIDYFQFRGLRFASGRNMATLGECVAGDRVARELGIRPGSSIVSSPEGVFDLAGVYPLKMRLTGVLAPRGSPDDSAIFVDLKTAWVIEGLGHGHQDLASADASPGVLSRDRSKIVANASVVEYTEIDASNLDSFHFHGDRSKYPITAVIAIPRDQKAGVILRGRYESNEDPCQIFEPVEVMNVLLSTVLTVESYVAAAFVVVGLSTLATATLVFLLSLRLRHREIQTMVKIGGSRAAIAGLLASEIVLVLLASLGLGGVLTALTGRFGYAAIRAFLLS